MNSTIDRNVLRRSQRYHTSINNIVGSNLSINNNKRAASDVYEDVCNKMLNELLPCRDGHLRLSSTSFNGNDKTMVLNSKSATSLSQMLAVLPLNHVEVNYVYLCLW